MGDWTITGKKHQVDGVEKDLIRDNHIKPIKTPDGKLIVITNDAAEDHAVIEKVDKHGAKIKK